MNVNHAACIPMHVSPKIQTKLGPIHHNIAHCATCGLKPPQGPFNLLELNWSFLNFSVRLFFCPSSALQGHWGLDFKQFLLAEMIIFITRKTLSFCWLREHLFPSSVVPASGNLSKCSWHTNYLEATQPQTPGVKQPPWRNTEYLSADLQLFISRTNPPSFPLLH